MDLSVAKQTLPASAEHVGSVVAEVVVAVVALGITVALALDSARD